MMLLESWVFSRRTTANRQAGKQPAAYKAASSACRAATHNKPLNSALQQHTSAHYRTTHTHTHRSAQSRTCCTAERCLHLSQLDAHSVDLDLPINASKEVQVAVGPPAHQVTCNNNKQSTKRAGCRLG